MKGQGYEGALQEIECKGSLRNVGVEAVVANIRKTLLRMGHLL